MTTATGRRAKNAQFFIRAAIGNLKGDNDHHRFERLAHRHAQCKYDLDLVLPTGPVSAGGDRGADAKSRWFDGESSVNLGRPRTVLACTTTAKVRLVTKAAADVKKARHPEILARPRTTTLIVHDRSISLVGRRHRLGRCH